MSIEMLLACLGSYRRPTNVESWVRAEPEGESGQEIPADFRRAVDILLANLGLVANGEFTSPTAYYFVQSLRYSIREQALSAEAWRGPISDPRLGLGARLVRTLESHRAAVSENPAAQRSVQAVMGIIKARRGTRDVYLMQFDKGANQFQPLGGKREAYDASNEIALARELSEELEIPPLTVGRDFNLRPLVEGVKMHSVSASLHIVTQYEHSFYHVVDIHFPIKPDDQTRWITAEELEAGKTVDGLNITALMDEYLPGVLPTLENSLPLLLD